MSDDLVRRFSTYNVMMSAEDGKEVPTPDGKWVQYKDYKTAADRIEELEANALANRVAIMRLEAKLAKALRLAEEAFDFNIEDAGPRAWHSINDRIEELKGQ